MNEKLMDQFRKLSASDQKEMLEQMELAHHEELKTKLIQHLDSFAEDAKGNELPASVHHQIQKKLDILASAWRARRSSPSADVGDVSYADLIEADVLQFLKKQKKPVNKRAIETGVVDGQKFDPKVWTNFARHNLEQAGGKGAGVLWKIKK